MWSLSSPNANASVVCRSALSADVNGDGEVSLDEFVKIMLRPINGNPPEFEESELVAMFMDMDHDGGGTVCYDEFALAWAAEGEELGIASASPDGAK